MKIAIAGATGLTGKLCLKLLLDHPKVTSVTAIGRRHVGEYHPKLFESLLTEMQLRESIQVDAFISCLGTTIKQSGSKSAFNAVDLELPTYIAEKLRENGCQAAAVVSAIGADSKSSFFYNQTKGRVEEAFKRIGFESLTILQPSIIDGTRDEERPGEKIGLKMMKGLSFIFRGPLKNYAPVKAEAIAERLVKSVLSAKPGATIIPSADI